MSNRSKTPSVALSEVEMLEGAKKRKQAAVSKTMTPPTSTLSKAAKTSVTVDATKTTRTPLQEGETVTIRLPKNFGEITSSSIFPAAERLAFPAP